jgi:RNA polymerase sigma-70 factor (ECF subfamily)
LTQIISKEEYTQYVFDEYYVEILNFVLSRIGYDIDLSKDITQEVFIKAWCNRMKYNEHKGSIRTWIYTIARNHLTDYYRSKEKTKFKPESNIDGVIDSFDLQIEDKEMVQFVMHKVDNMNEGERELIYLRYIQELSIKEIAIITNRSQVAIKVAIHRAIKKLRGIIDEEE